MIGLVALVLVVEAGGRPSRNWMAWQVSWTTMATVQMSPCSVLTSMLVRPWRS
jgi:hypothetical protein